MKAGPIIATCALVATLGSVALGVKYWKSRQLKKEQESAHAGGPPPEPVELTSVGSTTWQPTADLVGTVFAIQSVTLRNETAGVVKSVGFDSGQLLQEGDVLVKLDDSTEQADRAAAAASVRVAEAEVVSSDVRIRLAETNLNRLTKALAAKAVADAEVDTARAELDRAKADRDRAVSAVDQAKSRVQQVQVAIEKKTIKCPFKARAGIRSVHPGQYLAEGADIVGLQGVSDKIYLDFAVPQEYAAQASPGMKVMAQSKIMGDQPVPIEVLALDATVSMTTRNVRIRGRVDNPNERLRPGMSVDVRVPVGPPVEYAVVPSAAIRRASFGDHVFVIVAGEQPSSLVAKQRMIKTGPLIGSDQIVLEGLKVGEQIAGAGSFKLRDSAGVIPAKAQPTKSPEASAVGK